jgi:hypothetical protein
LQIELNFLCAAKEGLVRNIAYFEILLPEKSVRNARFEELFIDLRRPPLAGACA